MAALIMKPRERGSDDVSLRVIAWVVNNLPEQANMGQCLTATMLAWFARTESGQAWPKLAELAKMTRQDERSTRRSLRALVDMGFLHVDQPSTNRLPTMYGFPGYQATLLGGTDMTPLDELGGTETPPLDDALGGQKRHSGGTKTPPPNRNTFPVSNPVSSSGDSPAGESHTLPTFDDFWSLYPPKHGSKKLTKERWDRLKVAEQEAIMAALPAWLASDRWQRGFVKEAQSFISLRMWEDEAPPPVDTVRRNGNGRRNGPDIRATLAYADQLREQGL